MNDTIRARQPDQIDARKQQLLAAAEEMAASMDISQITLSALAQHAGFTKSNVYRYFSNQSDIFIALFQSKAKHCLSELQLLLRYVSPCDAVHNSRQHKIKELTDIFQKLFASHEPFLKLLAPASVIFEQGASIEKIVSMKASFAVNLQANAAELVRIFPHIELSNAQKFISDLIIYLAGLWPLSHPRPDLKAALVANGLGQFVFDFEARAKNTLDLFLTDMTKSKETQ